MKELWRLAYGNAPGRHKNYLVKKPNRGVLRQSYTWRRSVAPNMMGFNAYDYAEALSPYRRLMVVYQSIVSAYTKVSNGDLKHTGAM